MFKLSGMIKLFLSLINFNNLRKSFEAFFDKLFSDRKEYNKVFISKLEGSGLSQ